MDICCYLSWLDKGPTQIIALLIFPALVRKSSEVQLFKYNSQMGKEVFGQKNSIHPASKTPKIRKEASKTHRQERSKEKYDQFFEFLKRVHGGQSQEQQLPIVDEPLIKEVTESVVRFFNYQKNYKQQELQRYVIYLANLLNILKDKGIPLKFKNEFKVKIRRFLSCIHLTKTQDKSKNSKIQAILYILAILIYQERVKQDHSIQEINNSIYSDKLLVKSLLSLTLTKYKKMSKFYGVVLIHLTNQINSNKVKEDILRSIFLNMGKVDHEATFFNFLVYLRSEKNKVKINYHHIVQGSIFEILLQAYSKYLNRPESYYILDYMNHLLTLFPSLASKIPTQMFVSRAMLSSTPENIHHPLQQSTIVSFVQMILKYAESNAKNIMLDQIIDQLLSNKHLIAKFDHLVAQHEIRQEKMMYMLEKGYMQSLLSFINPNSQESLIKKIAQICKKFIANFEKINKYISEYIKYQLKCRLQLTSNTRFQIIF